MSATDNGIELGMLNKVAHANFCLRCLYGLPATMAEADSSRRARFLTPGLRCVAVGFYCLGALDILGLLGAKLSEVNREAWRTWIWAQQVARPRLRQQGDEVGSVGSGERNTSAGTDAEQRVGGGDEGAGPDSVPSSSSSRRDEADKQDADDDEEDGYIGGFRPGPFMHVGHDESSVPALESDSRSTNTVDADPPHLIMSYTALLALAILRDDFTALDRRGLVGLLRATQKADGSFSAIPGQGEADIRMVYTAFAICAMLDDWRGVDVPRALAFVQRCASYEGGFGQAPGNEAQGGPTYCALATLALAPPTYKAEAQLNREERWRAERWLVQQQRQGFTEGGGQGEDGGAVEEGEEAEGGGFGGRTEKDADACYSFWCGAALRILRSGMLVGGVSSPESERDVRGFEGDEEQVRKEEEKADFVERLTHARFLSRCQFRLGGLAKAPGAHPDPYHTYLALAALALYPPYPPYSSGEAEPREEDSKNRKERERESWRLPRLDPLINATVETARWARAKISGREQMV